MDILNHKLFSFYILFSYPSGLVHLVFLYSFSPFSILCGVVRFNTDGTKKGLTPTPIIMIHCDSSIFWLWEKVIIDVRASCKGKILWAQHKTSLFRYQHQYFQNYFPFIAIAGGHTARKGHTYFENGKPWHIIGRAAHSDMYMKSRRCTIICLTSLEREKRTEMESQLTRINSGYARKYISFVIIAVFEWLNFLVHLVTVCRFLVHLEGQIHQDQGRNTKKRIFVILRIDGNRKALRLVRPKWIQTMDRYHISTCRVKEEITGVPKTN